MSSLPVSPPLTAGKWSFSAQTTEKPPTRQTTHGTAASSTRNGSSSVFKKPALPDRRKPAVQPNMDKPRTGRAKIIQHDSESPTTNEPSLIPVTASASLENLQGSNVNTHSLQTRPHSVWVESENAPLAPTSVPKQEVYQESMAKEFGYQHEEELELHRRVNRHVNAYLKKVCRIAGGVKLFTERQAWVILSGLTPLDITTDPEVFEPVDTDQLAKFLNHRRKILEDFQQARMPMPALPLLSLSSPYELRTDTQRENANLSLEWGLRGIVNRDRWTITQSDLAVIKAEVGLLQKITRLSTFLPPMKIQLESPQMIDVMLSRVAIRKTTRYANHTRQNQDSSAQEDPLRSLQPFRNSVQHFRDVKNIYKLAHVDGLSPETGTLLSTALKMKDVCDMSLSINQNEIKLIKEEIRKVMEEKQRNAEHRLKSLVLTPEWARSCAEVSIKLDVDTYSLSLPITPATNSLAQNSTSLLDMFRGQTCFSSTISLPLATGNVKDQSTFSTQETRTGMQRLLNLVEPLSPTFSDKRYMLNSDDTPTLAASTSSLEEVSSLPASPIQQAIRSRPESYHSVLQYQWPAVTALEAEKMEVPLLPKHRLAPHDSSIVGQPFPTPMIVPAAIPISSSPDEEAQALAGTTEEQAGGKLQLLYSRLPDKGKKSRALVLTPPGLLTDIPDCGKNSNYMAVPTLTWFTQGRGGFDNAAKLLPESLKDMVPSTNSQKVGTMVPCKGVQSLGYEIYYADQIGEWTCSIPSGETGNGFSENLLSPPAGSSSETSSVAIAPVKCNAQECLLHPPMLGTVIEYPTCPIEQYHSFPITIFAIDQRSSRSPSDPLSCPSAHVETTNPSGVADDFTVIQEKQRSSTVGQTTVAHDSAEDKAGKQAQSKLSISETEKRRPSEIYDRDLDRFICERNQGNTGTLVDQKSIAIPTSRISRYLLTREPASHRLASCMSSFFQDKQRHNDPDNENATSFGNEMIARNSPAECEFLALDERPTNPPDISLGIERVIRSAETLPILPIMVDTHVYNKRSLCSALHRLGIQPYGHDHLEADIILNLKTACVLMPLASLVSNSEELVQRLVTLAHSFENLIVIFDLYPAKRITTSQAAMPDPWNPSTRVTFTQFQGRLKRQILWKIANNSGFEHKVNAYLSDDANTLAALLRIHVDLESLPVGSSMYRHSDDIDIEDPYAWLSVDLGPEESQIRDGLQLNSAASLYIAQEYGLSAFLEVCKSRNDNIELMQLLGEWNMDTTREIVRSRAAEAMMLEGEGSVDRSESLVADASLTILLEDQNHSLIFKEGSRQILNTPPVALASNDDSYGTEFETEITPDQNLQGEETYYSLGLSPTYFQDSSTAVVPVRACEEIDELSLNPFEWN